MAATETEKVNRLTLTVIDADWVAPRALKILGLLFVPGAGADNIVLRDDSVTGAVITDIVAGATTNAVIQIFPAPIYATPAIETDDCTIGAGHQLTFFLG